jgi:alpha-galactosidase
MGRPRGGLGLMLACAVAVAIGLGGGRTARADFWDNAPGTAHWYNYASHKCLSVLTEAAEPGFPVDQYDCRNAAAQEWGSVKAAQITDHRADGCHCTYSVYLWPNHNGGSCMALADRSGANGTPVITAPCDPQDATQWWHIGPSKVGRSSAFGSNNRWVIQNYGVGKCLDVENGDNSNELPMQLWDCNTSTLNQSWASDSGPKAHFP